MIALVVIGAALLIVGWLVRRVTPMGRPTVEYYNEPADYLSYGEVEHVPGCECRPSNVLYWELSPAITDDCPIHGPAS